MKPGPHKKGDIASVRVFSRLPHIGASLAYLEDITVAETNRQQLHSMLESLEQSRDEIRQQNEELQVLAARDPLTSCLNRRSFFESPRSSQRRSARWSRSGTACRTR